MAAILGVDISENQPLALPWAEWATVRVAVVRASIGFRDDPAFTGHVAAAHRQGVIVGAYHALLGHAHYDPVRQAADFLAALVPEIEFCALDIETPGISEPDMRAWCDHYDAHSRLPLVLYGNQLLAQLITQDPVRYSRYSIWWAEYGPARPTSTPPYVSHHAPAGLNVIGWQYAGDNGRLEPYPWAIDLTDWDKLPNGEVKTTMPVIYTGPKLGIHSIKPGTTIPLVRQALAAGWHWPLVKILHDASVCVDIKAISPQTLTICRYMPHQRRR
jgi:GH25 family lysozyme M1 (1,4-beta-N-acetylmuramidase)